jgi:hypothetical protein
VFKSQLVESAVELILVDRNHLWQDVLRSAVRKYTGL